MAEGGCPVPPWDPRTEEESGLFDYSPHSDLLRRHRVELRDKLQVSKLWAHLRQLKVLRQNDEERIREGAARCDAVERLLDHIRTCATWQYHGLLRALALTGQAALIPGGGLGRDIYTQGAKGTAPPLTQEQCRIILDHCEACVDKLMRRSLFTFEDPADHYVDTSKCLVISKATFKGLRQKMQIIEADEILRGFNDKEPPKTVLLYGPPGAGKTTYTTHFVYSFCLNFMKSFGQTSDTSTSLPWNLMVYIPAKEITGTIEEAIRDHLWCREEDLDALMHYVMTGEGVVIVIDALDEVRDTQVIENLKAYVKQRHGRKGGPQVLVSCRTDAGFLDDKEFEKEFDRFLVLEGFTPSQGLEYTSFYCAKSQQEHGDSHQPLDQLLGFVQEYKDTMEHVITNPLRLHLFCILASKGYLHLSKDGNYSIPNLLRSFETHILSKEGTVSQEDSDTFYRFCLKGLLDRKGEFPESDVMKTQVAKPYLIFFEKHKRRDKTGVFVTYYSFSHEVFLEYFAAKAICTLSLEGKKAVILYSCLHDKLTNFQKIIFELLYDSNDMPLMQGMLCAILLLQYTFKHIFRPPANRQLLCDRRSIKDNISPERILATPLNNDLIRCVDEVWEHVKLMIAKCSDSQKEFAMFTWLQEDIFNIVVKCIQICEIPEQISLMKNTIHRLFPVQSKRLYQHFDNNKYIVTRAIYAIDEMRWAEVSIDPGFYITMKVWSPQDVPELLRQHSSWCSPDWRQLVNPVQIDFGYTELWGKPTAEHWSMQSWAKLFNDFMWSPETKRQIHFRLHQSTPLGGLLEYLGQSTHSAVLLSYGTAKLVDLMTFLTAYRKPRIFMRFEYTTIIVPDHVALDEVRLLNTGLLEGAKLVRESGDVLFKQRDISPMPEIVGISAELDLSRLAVAADLEEGPDGPQKHKEKKKKKRRRDEKRKRGNRW